MKKMTKEECLKALDNLSRYADIGRAKHGAGGCVVDDFVSNNEAVIYNLICDNFDNPPLYYAEIEEGKWYWHNKKKEWVKVLNKDVCTSDIPIIETAHEYIEFELNCFYRKQVEE